MGGSYHDIFECSPSDGTYHLTVFRMVLVVNSDQFLKSVNRFIFGGHRLPTEGLIVLKFVETRRPGRHF